MRKWFLPWEEIIDIMGVSRLVTLSHTLWQFSMAIENGDLYLIYLLKMVIFHSYVSLPEGTSDTCHKSH